MVSQGIVGLAKDSEHITDVAFDILSLEALFLVPRVCSLLSLIPFFGTLVRKSLASSELLFLILALDTRPQRNGRAQ